MIAVAARGWDDNEVGTIVGVKLEAKQETKFRGWRLLAMLLLLLLLMLPNTKRADVKLTVVVICCRVVANKEKAREEG